MHYKSEVFKRRSLDHSTDLRPLDVTLVIALSRSIAGSIDILRKSSIDRLLDQSAFHSFNRSLDGSKKPSKSIMDSSS